MIISLGIFAYKATIAIVVRETMCRFVAAEIENEVIVDIASNISEVNWECEVGVCLEYKIHRQPGNQDLHC